MQRYDRWNCVLHCVCPCGCHQGAAANTINHIDLHDFILWSNEDEISWQLWCPPHYCAVGRSPWDIQGIWCHVAILWPILCVIFPSLWRGQCLFSFSYCEMKHLPLLSHPTSTVKESRGGELVAQLRHSNTFHREPPMVRYIYNNAYKFVSHHGYNL